MTETSGVVCPNCEYVNMEGALICENCSAILTDQPPRNVTRQFEPEDEAPAEEAVAEEAAELGADVFTDDMVVVVDFGDIANPRQLRVDGQVKIGRIDRMTSTLIDFDLGGVGGWERGVSRLHAMLERIDNQLMLCDLKSANGTWLNSQRLTPGENYLVHDGDAIRLGLLDLRVYFVKEADIAKVSRPIR